MSTLCLDPGNHPQRRAALAAHALREALAAVGLLEAIPECTVANGRAVVRIGEIDASAALALAMQLTRAHRSRKRKRPAQSATESGAS